MTTTAAPPPAAAPASKRARLAADAAARFPRVRADAERAAGGVWTEDRLRRLAATFRRNEAFEQVLRLRTARHDAWYRLPPLVRLAVQVYEASALASLLVAEAERTEDADGADDGAGVRGVEVEADRDDRRDRHRGE